MKKDKEKAVKAKKDKANIKKTQEKHLLIMHSMTSGEMELKGPVSKVEQYLCKASFKSGFIVQGQLVNDIHIEDTITAWFNEKGQKIKQEHFWHENDSTIEFFNEQGLATEYQLFREGKQYSWGTKKYNAYGKISEMSSFNEKNVYTNGHVWKYDDKGNNVVVEYYGPEKNITQSMVMIYNEKDQKTEDKRTNGAGEITYWAKIKYDLYGYECERTMLNSDGSVKENKVNRNIYDADGKLIGQDDRIYRKDPPLEEAEAEHDGWGNWVTKIKFYNNVPAAIVFRDISYFGEAEKPSGKDSIMDHPIKFPYTEDTISKWQRIEIEKSIEEMFNPPAPLLHTREPELVRWLAEVATPESFPAVRYYALVNNDIPTTVYFDEDDYEVLALLCELRREMGATLLHSYQNRSGYGEDSSITRYTLGFPNKGYLLMASQITTHDSDEFKVPNFISSAIDDFYDGWVRISPLILLRPSEASGKRDEDFESELENYMDLCILESQPDKPEISMVEVDNNGNFKLRTYPVYDNFIIKDLDMHYGYGFEKFHNDLMRRFESESRGLVLFHGMPGTGKTYYIRHLLRKMTSSKKVVIYMPPNMVDRLIDPYFITFLSKTIASFSKDGFFCVLLIEDAEPLLASRQGEGRVMGISNLLNMTDGILNDMLKLQIICTFNVKVRELDKALLRPGRLIARKEFKAMTTLDANRLGQQLGVKHHFDKPATLAEVYALVKNKNTLTHGEGEIEADID